MNKILILILILAIAIITSGCISRQEVKEEISPEIAEIVEKISLPSSVLNQEQLTAFADDAVSGGPPKDGIPAIDKPKFTSAEEADKWLDDNDIVFGVVQNGIVKAYPQPVLVWHEIVNDEFDGKKVSVTYCPLTGTVIGFNRVLDDTETTFGVSGKLINNNVIMYDRLTDSYWPQVLGAAVKGPLFGSRLEEFPVIWTTWGLWKEKYPDTLVLSKETGYIRNYNRDPYGDYNPIGGYYVREATIFSNMAEDDRFPPKTVVVGARSDGEAFAVVKDVIRQEKVINTNLGEIPIVIFYDEELDTVRFFNSLINENSVTFMLLEDGTIHDPSGLEWNVEGLNKETGEQLEQINAFDAMWFAWFAFYPNTEVYNG